MVGTMDFTEMREAARAVRARYAAMEDRRFGRPWTAEEVMLGFVGDVGDLAKLVQGRAGVRPTPDLDERSRTSWPIACGAFLRWSMSTESILKLPSPTRWHR